MSLDQILSGLIYLLSLFVLLGFGKLLYDLLHPRFVLRTELFERDNVALAVTVAGYYLGLILALGGVLSGPSSGLWVDLIDIGLYGLAAVLLLNLSAWMNDKIILSKFDNQKEIIDDRNAGTGAIEAGNHIANGLIISGALSGQGDLLTALVFWLLGQLALIVGSKIYTAMVAFDVHDEVEKDNVAVGVAFAGVLVGLGYIAGLATSGDFVSWAANLGEYGVYVGVGLLLLPVIRWTADRILVPGVSLDDELVGQEHPNLGAGILEAFSYVAAAILIGWSF